MLQYDKPCNSVNCFWRCGGLIMSLSSASIQILVCSPHFCPTTSGTGKKMGRSKVGKLMGWNKDSLISQGEGKRNLWWQSWPHTSRPMPCYSWVVATLEDNLLRFTVLQLCYWVWHYMMWKVPLASLRSVVSTLCPAASLPAGMGKVEQGKPWWLCNCCSAWGKIRLWCCASTI